jgi:hypothetical protein
MRLLDLEPRWLEFDGQKVAIMFFCPHCAANRDTWLTCFFKPSGDLPRIPSDHPIEGLRGCGGSRLLVYEALRQIQHPDPIEGCYHNVVMCKKSIAWNRVGDDFATMSITPSIDASASGHWHGFVTNGDIA